MKVFLEKISCKLVIQEERLLFLKVDFMYQVGVLVRIKVEDGVSYYLYVLILLRGWFTGVADVLGILDLSFFS